MPEIMLAWCLHDEEGNSHVPDSCLQRSVRQPMNKDSFRTVSDTNHPFTSAGECYGLQEDVATKIIAFTNVVAAEVVFVAFVEVFVALFGEVRVMLRVILIVLIVLANGNDTGDDYDGYNGDGGDDCDYNGGGVTDNDDTIKHNNKHK